MVSRVGLAAALVGALLCPPLGEAVNVTPKAQYGQATATANISITDSTGKKQEGKSGDTFDVQQGQTRVSLWGEGLWIRNKNIQITERDQFLELQTNRINPTDLWSPPTGIFTGSPVFFNDYIGDAQKYREIRTDLVVGTGQKFVNRADASALHVQNNDQSNRFNMDFSGVYGGIGLPTFLDDCDCVMFRHGVGGNVGYGGINMHTYDRRDQQAGATYLNGGGVAGGFEYNATALMKPGKRIVENLGFRAGYSWLNGTASVNRTPANSDGVGALGAGPAGGNEGRIYWTMQKVYSDVLYNICNRNLYAFVGVEYRTLNFQARTTNPVNVGGFGLVNRTIDKTFSNSNVLPRFGLDGQLPSKYLPVGFPPLFARGEVTVGPGGSAYMFKVGTGFDLLNSPLLGGK